MQIYSDKNQMYQKKRSWKSRLIIFFLLIILVAFSIYYWVVLSSFFKIQSIFIENNECLSEEELMSELDTIVLGRKIGGILGVDNILAWPSGEVLVANPVLLSAKIEKEWLDRVLKIKVNERERFAIWCVDDNRYCYWLDRGGVIFAEAPLTEGSLLPVVSDSRKDKLVLGDSAEEERFVKNLIFILDNINKTGFEPVKIYFDKNLMELKVNTLEGTVLLFSTRFNSVQNIALIKDLGSQKLEYIDLRVENKIFYKTTN